MRILYDEICRVFPELRSSVESDAELPYMLMIHLADWAKRNSESEILEEDVSRLVSFSKWCQSYPRGQDASDDLLTIWTVGFYEHLFDSEKTRKLLPRFGSQKEYIGNEKYLKSWIGPDRYEKGLGEFSGAKRRGSEATSRRRR